MSGEHEKAVRDMAVEHGLADHEMLEVYERVAAALRQAFGSCDSGIARGQCDFWVKHGGREYMLVLHPYRGLTH